MTVLGDGGPLIAVFDASDATTRSVAAVDTAVDVLAHDVGTDVEISVAVAFGRAHVGSIRVEEAGARRWTYGAEGGAVDHATELAGRGDDAVLLSDDAARLVADRFALEDAHAGTYRMLSSRSDDREPARQVETFLVTDIVGSTRTLEHIGDRAWAERLVALEQATRAELVIFAGREVDTAGDGFLVSFDAPARAVRCARALIDRAAALALSIRVGIHTGEVEHVGGRPRGIAVNIASRIADHAGAGEILVSATTRELAAGSGLTFADRGEHRLKGVSEPRRLFAVVADGTVLDEGPTKRGPDGEYPFGLTRREVDVLRLVALGLSDAAAADRLVLSVRTVHAHLRSTYRKLGVRSRAGAARFALVNGLV